MNHIREVKEDAINFFGFGSDDERHTIIRKIVDYAESSETNHFIDELRSTFELSSESGIGVVYEALTKNPGRWCDFFLEEYQRAFKMVLTSAAPDEIISALDDIGNIQSPDDHMTDSFVRLLTPYFNSEHRFFRQMAVWFIGDWVTERNVNRYRHVVTYLKERLKDKHWKVRLLAKEALEDMDQLPAGFRIRPLDRLKEKWFNQYELK